MTIKLAHIPKVFFLITLLFYCLASVLNLRAMEYSVDSGPLAGIVISATFALWSLSFVKLAIPRYRLYMPTWTISLYCLFALWSVIPTLLASNSTTNELIFNTVMVLTPALILYITYNTIVNCGDSKWFHAYFLITALLLSLQYINVYREVNFLETLHLVCSYYVLYILPLVLLTRSKALRITAVFLVTIILFSSLKRTGILSLAMGIMVFIFVGQYVENRFKVKSFAISLVLLLSLGGIFLYLDTQGDESVLERFETIDQDHGSFRLEVWEHTSAMISNQDVGSLLIGNGYNTVERDSRLNKSAHNDILEVTYDYGLIGAILYIAAIISLFFCIVRMILNKSPYAPSLSMLFVIYMVSSMISHIIIYYWGNLFMLTIGYIIGNNKKDAAD